MISKGVQKHGRTPFVDNTPHSRAEFRPVRPDALFPFFLMRYD